MNEYDHIECAMPIERAWRQFLDAGQTRAAFEAALESVLIEELVAQRDWQERSGDGVYAR